MSVRAIAVLLSLLGPMADYLLAQFSSREPRYRIQAGDVLDMKLRYTPEFNQTVTVAPDGFVSTEIAGDLKVSGLTLTEALNAMKAAVGKRLLDPDVSVTLREFVKPQVTVTGEVMKPGMFDLRGSLTATQAVALAGGFRENAKHSTVALVRRVDNQWAEVKVLDMKRMMNGQQLTEDVTLSPGDLLVVPQSRLGRMERLVRWTSLSVFGIAALRPLTN
ncbi:MAG: polysaccharide export protein [Bryobacterales bacterium]|nr:polysaccharide export protein [Bryobacterales bacterium]